MTNHGDFSPEAAERARRTGEAAAVFADHAEVILADLAAVPETHILVAVVSDGLQFVGTYQVDSLELVARVPELERHGWAMVFSRTSTLADVQRRTDEMASIASQRAAAIDRISARRTQQS
jgi:hypothetical protein